MLDVDLSIRDVGGRAGVALRGELNLAGSPGVAAHLIAAVAACRPSVIVDLAGLDGTGDGAVPVLLGVLRWTRRCGGDLPLAAPSGRCARSWRPARRLLGASQRRTRREQRTTGPAVVTGRAAATPAAMATGSRNGQPAYRTARHRLARPLPRPGTRRPRHRCREPAK